MKSRFDLVMEIFEILEKYLDSCAAKTNTKAMILKSKDLILELEAIEKEIDGKIEGKLKITPFSTAFEEFNLKYPNTLSAITETKEFFTNNHENLNILKTGLLSLEKMSKLAIKLDKTIKKYGVRKWENGLPA